MESGFLVIADDNLMQLIVTKYNDVFIYNNNNDSLDNLMDIKNIEFIEINHSIISIKFKDYKIAYFNFIKDYIAIPIFNKIMSYINKNRQKEWSIKMNWIKFKDRQPDFDQSVLFYDDSYIPKITINKLSNIIMIKGALKPTHWMELPISPKSDIKVCPFCGIFPHIKYSENYYSISCINKNCNLGNVSMPQYLKEKDAIDNWNKRYNENE